MNAEKEGKILQNITKAVDESLVRKCGKNFANRRKGRLDMPYHVQIE